MSRARRTIALAALLAWVSAQGQALGQIQGQPQSQAQNVSAAKEVASALGQNLQGAITSGVTNGDAPNSGPTYQGSDLPQTSYYDAPDQLASAGATASLTSVGVALTTNPNRPSFDSSTIDLTNAKAIEAAPANYAGGTGAGGTAGKCEPLPATSGTSSTYYDSCQIGQAESDVTFTCHVGWKPQLATSYEYQCHTKWLTLNTMPFAQASDCGDFPVTATCTRIATQDNALGNAGGASGWGLNWTVRQSDDTIAARPRAIWAAAPPTCLPSTTPAIRWKARLASPGFRAPCCSAQARPRAAARSTPAIATARSAAPFARTVRR